MSAAFVFFQAEDGIRDYKVTGVQTCALPISREETGSWLVVLETGQGYHGGTNGRAGGRRRTRGLGGGGIGRSGEGRVGEKGWFPGGAEPFKKKQKHKLITALDVRNNTF